VEVILPMKPEIAEKADLHGKEFALQYGPLILSTAICDSTNNSGNYIFRGADPFLYLRFASVPGKMPLFTFTGFSDTTLVFQPAFSLQQQCNTSWIRWEKISE